MNELLPIPANDAEPTDDPLVMAALTEALAEPAAVPQETAAAETNPPMEAVASEPADHAPETEEHPVIALTAAAPAGLELPAPEASVEAPPTAPVAPADEEQPPPAIAELPAAPPPARAEEPPAIRRLAVPAGVAGLAARCRGLPTAPAPVSITSSSS